MSTHLPVISARNAVNAFSKIDFELLPATRGKGSHMVMIRRSTGTILTIPNHRELKRGTLRKLIRDAGLTVDEFRNLI